jgi:hypothetical protein
LKYYPHWAEEFAGADAVFRRSGVKVFRAKPFSFAPFHHPSKPALRVITLARVEVS